MICLFVHAAALVVGFVVDLLLGDPRWIPHPIRAIGRLIEVVERFLRSVFPKTEAGERVAGVVLVIVVCVIPTALCVVVLWLCSLVAWQLAFAVECVICYQLVATKSLKVESSNVLSCLKAGDLDGARRAVAMIVARDTGHLTVTGVTRATVETVAENTSDGVVAPLIFMGIGGAPLGMLYKAVNTMDSMVGYRNDRYRHFGTAAARLDDVLNFLPSRLAAALMCLGAAIVRLDAKGAFRIWRHDHGRHLSPNSAQTESACAGALGVMLGGPSCYFGKTVDKPTIGDPVREIEPNDIARANRLLYATGALSLAVAVALSALVSLAILVLLAI